MGNVHLFATDRQRVCCRSRQEIVRERPLRGSMTRCIWRSRCDHFARRTFPRSLRLFSIATKRKRGRHSPNFRAVSDCDHARPERCEAMDSLTRARNRALRTVASSKAMRLKPHAIDIRVSVDPVQYFLNEREDTRSSYYLEDAATEFQVQGLELDWVCVNWDGDFRFNGSAWDYHDFRGNRWCNIANADNRVYLRTHIEFCSRERDKVWWFSFRLATQTIKRARPHFTIQLSIT